MYDAISDLLPEMAIWVAAWSLAIGIVAGTIIKVTAIVRGSVPKLRNAWTMANAAIELVNEQLTEDSGASLVDRVRETRDLARQANDRITSHIERDHRRGKR